ncbi:hypothetical protein PMI40_00221, partial [Herbaspirillum sp. YR522]
QPKRLVWPLAMHRYIQLGRILINFWFV